MTRKIDLDFGKFVLQAELFDNQTAKRFVDILPCKVYLTQWGNELYGSIGKNLGEEHPVPTIPPGGLAYTNNGNYLCVFFGQTPAWSVEYLGKIEGDQWKILINEKQINSVLIKLTSKTKGPT